MSVSEEKTPQTTIRKKKYQLFCVFLEAFNQNSFLKFKKRTNKSLLLNVAELKMLGTKKANNDTKSKNGKRKVENGKIDVESEKN